MQYQGEIISLAVALSWTVNALCSDIASHRFGALPFNIVRMALSLLLLSGLLLVLTGSPIPVRADSGTWFWMALSGLVGYVFGDYCLYNSYVIFGSKFGQLFMTIAPPVAGITGWIFLGEKLGDSAWLAMLVTLTGIAISILARDGKSDGHHPRLKLKLPVKGVLFGIGAGVGQGSGLVLSKIGLEHYASSLPDGTSQQVLSAMPFAGTFIRAIFGFAGFFLIILLSSGKGSGRFSGFTPVLNGMKDGKTMRFALYSTIFGPFVGVSLSLMAVQYTKAGIASTLMALVPVFIIIPYSIINRQRIKFIEVLGTFVTIAGIAMFFLL